MLSLIGMFIACAIMLLAERELLKSFPGYLTPAVVVVGSIGFVYLLPYGLALYGFDDPRFYPGRLTENQLNAGVAVVRTFVWMLAIMYLLAVVLVRKKIEPCPLRFRVSRKVLVYMTVVSVLVWLLHLGLAVRFNPLAMLDRAINPREYTKLRVGYGFLTYARAIVFLVFSVLSAAYIFWPVNTRRAVARAKNSKGYLSRSMFFVVACALSILGGSKTNVVGVFLFFLFFLQYYLFERGFVVRRRKYRTNKKNRGLVKDVLIKLSLLIAGAGVLFIAFGAMRTQEINESELSILNHVLGYQREAHNTALVVSDFEWDTKYLATGFSDVVLSGIPRAIFPEKPVTGFYQRYWKPVYEPRKVGHHASTFGCLAETHMMYGAMGPYVAALLLVLAMLVIYRLMFRPRDVRETIVAVFALYWMYFFVRAGFMGAVMLYVIIIVIGVFALISVARNLGLLLLVGGRKRSSPTPNGDTPRIVGVV